LIAVAPAGKIALSGLYAALGVRRDPITRPVTKRLDVPREGCAFSADIACGTRRMQTLVFTARIENVMARESSRPRKRHHVGSPFTGLRLDHDGTL